MIKSKDAAQADVRSIFPYVDEGSESVAHTLYIKNLPFERMLNLQFERTLYLQFQRMLNLQCRVGVPNEEAPMKMFLWKNLETYHQ